MEQDVIKIYYHKDFELFSQDLIDITLKASWNISKAKKYDPILKVVLSATKGIFYMLSSQTFI